MNHRAHPTARFRAHAAICLIALVSLLTPAPAGASPAPLTGQWWAEYYANPTLSASPALTRYEDAINHNWGTASLGPEIPADGFSARWTREEWFDNGTYRFSVRSDDGLRVWIGDLLIIDAWHDQQADWLTHDLYINQGTYPVRVEYYENGGGAQVFLTWERISGGQGWRAEYYDNQTLQGTPALIRTDPAIDFAWGTGSPDATIPVDNFSVRWTYTLGFTAGTYRFFTSTDDGVRLWVDGHLVIDAWITQKLPNTQTGERALEEGLHHITVEYFEQGGEAHAHAWWQRLNGFAGWKGEYFDNRDMVGGPALVRDDAEIDFDWGTAPPAAWMPDDNFAARWTRELTFEPGYYRLSAQADDGVRVWLDDGLVIDQWQEMDNELHYVDGIYLSGLHRLKIEYYEQNGLARIHFWIGPASVSAPAPTTPSDPAAAPLAQGPWQASYFANSELEGEPILVRQDAVIDFDWKLGAPAPSLPEDHFSVRWHTTLDFTSGRYRFSTYTDDGFLLFLNGEPIIKNWWSMRGFRSTVLDLSGSPHTLVMEYFERTQAARARLSWTRIGPAQTAAPAPSSGAPGPWQAEYYGNQDLSGDPLLTQVHESLNFDWRFDAPAPDVPEDGFSIRWTTRRPFDSARYTFSTYSDDGVRLYVDGQRVIDSWWPMQGYRSATLDLSAGEHTIVLEYFEQGGIALVRLN